MKKIVVLFSGYGSNFEYLAKNQHKFKIVAAFSNNPNARGIEIAKKYHIPCFVLDSKKYDSRVAFEKALLEKMKLFEFDLAVLAGFMRILTPFFTSKIKAINLHPSLLPRHKGLDAIKKSFYDDFEEGGVTVHWVNEDLDGGEIILQKKVHKKSLNYEQYYQLIRKIEKEALLEAINVLLRE